MIWNEITTPLSADNLNALEIRISVAATSAADGKTAIASAITDKGIPSTVADTFAEMAAKIQQISGGYASGNIEISAGETKTIYLPWSKYCLFAARDQASDQRLVSFRSNFYTGTDHTYLAGYRAFDMTGSGSGGSSAYVVIKSNTYTGTLYWEAWQKA